MARVGALMVAEFFATVRQRSKPGKLDMSEMAWVFKLVDDERVA